jgi:mannose-6-phosphate isomerase-like protein (cupin superfamily)
MMELHDIHQADCHRISPGDTVKLAVLRAPATPDDTSMCGEVWDPGGAQPPNSHPRSVETFYFLRGSGVAECDGVETPVKAGDLLVLPPGSVHRIRNTGPGRLYAITTMSPDDGFVDLIRRGVVDCLDDDDLEVFAPLR